MWHCPPYSICGTAGASAASAAGAPRRASGARRCIATCSEATHPLHAHKGVGAQAGAADHGEVAALPAVLLLQGRRRRREGGGRRRRRRRWLCWCERRRRAARRWLARAPRRLGRHAKSRRSKLLVPATHKRQRGRRLPAIPRPYATTRRHQAIAGALGVLGHWSPADGAPTAPQAAPSTATGHRTHRIVQTGRHGGCRCLPLPAETGELSLLPLREVQSVDACEELECCRRRAKEPRGVPSRRRAAGGGAPSGPCAAAMRRKNVEAFTNVVPLGPAKYKKARIYKRGSGRPRHEGMADLGKIQGQTSGNEREGVG